MKQWQKKEIKDATSFGGKRTPRSGGFWSFPGDVKTDNFLIDSKKTDKNRYSITKQIWNKIDIEALKCRKIPILSVEFSDDNIQIVVLNKGDFLELFNKNKKS